MLLILTLKDAPQVTLPISFDTAISRIEPGPPEPQLPVYFSTASVSAERQRVEVTAIYPVSALCPPGN